MPSATPQITQLPGKKHNIVYGGDDVKLLGDINEPDCCVYISALPGSEIAVRGNIAAKSVHLGEGVTVSGHISITAEADIFIEEKVLITIPSVHTLIAGGNIILNTNAHIGKGVIIAGGDIYLNGGYTRANKIIAGGDIILGYYHIVTIEDYMLDGVKHEGTYQAGGKIYREQGRDTGFLIDRLNQKIVTRLYDENTPAVCLKNGVAMTGGAEIVPCAPTPILSSSLEGLTELMLPAPGVGNAVPYTATTGISPAHKAQAITYRNACWLSRSIQDSSGTYVSKNSFRAYITSNLDDLVSSCSLFAQLEPEKFAEAEVQHKYRKYVLEALYLESGERAISREALEEGTYHVAQAIASTDVDYFMAMGNEDAIGDTEPPSAEEPEPLRVNESGKERGSFFKALRGMVRKIF